MTTQIRTTGVELTREDRAYIKRRIDAKVRKFAKSVDEVDVRLSDVNGPKRWRRQGLQGRVLVPGLPNVMVERRHQSARAAVDGTMDATERAVRKNPRAAAKRAAPGALAGRIGPGPQTSRGSLSPAGAR